VVCVALSATVFRSIVFGQRAGVRMRLLAAAVFYGNVSELGTAYLSSPQLSSAHTVWL
jgi:hypothetical protein